MPWLKNTFVGLELFSIIYNHINTNRYLAYILTLMTILTSIPLLTLEC